MSGEPIKEVIYSNINFFSCACGKLMMWKGKDNLKDYKENKEIMKGHTSLGGCMWTCKLTYLCEVAIIENVEVMSSTLTFFSHFNQQTPLLQSLILLCYQVKWPIFFSFLTSVNLP